MKNQSTWGRPSIVGYKLDKRTVWFNVKKTRRMEPFKPGVNQRWISRMAPLPSSSPCWVEQMTLPDSIRKQRSVSCVAHKRRTKDLACGMRTCGTTVLCPREERCYFAGVRRNHDHDMKIANKQDIWRAKGDRMQQHKRPHHRLWHAYICPTCARTFKPHEDMSLLRRWFRRRLA